MISEPNAAAHIRQALQAYVTASPDEGLYTWVADLVGDLYEICLERDATLTVHAFRQAVARGADYADERRPEGDA